MHETTITDVSALKQRASGLLREYDQRRLELKQLEHELARACSDYGRATGVWGMNRDHLRIQLNHEKGE